MHENLKSTYSLSQQSNSKNEGWQTLVANSNYGTFYTIHGKFKFEENTNTPISCDLYLQNYQGNVTIGIVSVHENIFLVEDSLHDTPTFVLVVHLRALYANNYESNQPIKIDNSKLTKPHFKDINEFGTNHALKVEVIFDDVENFTKENHEQSPFIDQSIGIREGDDIVIPDYSTRVHYNFEEHYLNYFSLELGLIESDIKIEENVINKDTRPYNKKIENLYDSITIFDANGKKIDDRIVIKPHPCANNYVRFVQ